MLTAVALWALLAACADAPSAVGRPATVMLNFLTPATVRTVVVEVSGPGVAPGVVLNILVGSDSTARDTLTLSAGAGRRFVFSAFDSSGIATHRADTTIRLSSGTNAPLAVRLTPLASSVGLTVTFGGARVTVGDTSARSIRVGDTLRISATAVQANGTAVPADSLEWGTSNPAIATVTGGVVRALRSGSAVIGVSYRGASARIAVSVPATDLPTTGLLAWYSLDGHVADVSGSGRTGTLLAGAAAADRFGRSSSSLSFDGDRGGFASPAGIVNLGQESYSISLWASFSAFDAWARIGNGEVDALVVTNPHNGLAFGFDYNVQGRLSSAVGSGSVPWLSVYGAGTKSNFQLNKWYHFVVRKQGTTFTTWVDGVLDYSVTHSSVAGLNVPVVLNFGGGWSFPDNPGWGTINGAMDDVRVYGRALTDAEIAQIARDRP